MGYALLIAWAIQAAVGIALLAGWVRHAGGSGAHRVVPHVALMVFYLAPCLGFALTGVAWWAWIALAVLLVGIPFGDLVLLDRARRARDDPGRGLRGYGLAVAAIFAGQLPWKVAFHALFAPVVFFGTLAVAVIATVAAFAS